MKTCSVQPKRRDQHQSDNHETNDKTLYTLTTMINIFHDKVVPLISFDGVTG